MTADHYADAGHRWAAGPTLVYGPIATELVAMSPHPLAGRTVLDAGAGTGAVSSVLTARLAHPVAMDLSIDMLAWNARARPPCVVADIRALPVPAGRVDDALAAFVLNHLAEPSAGLAELARVTRPGGAVLAAVFSNASRSQARDRVDAVAQGAGWQVPGWYADLKANAVPILGSAEAMGAAADAAGLADIVVEERPVDVGVTEPEQLVSYRLGQPLFASWLDRIGPCRTKDIASHAADVIRPIMQPYRPIVVFLAASVKGAGQRGERPAGPLNGLPGISTRLGTPPIRHHHHRAFWLPVPDDSPGSLRTRSHTRVTPAVPDCTRHTVPETGTVRSTAHIDGERHALLLPDPAAATTPARDRVHIPEPPSGGPARALADRAAGAGQRPRRPAIRQARRTVTGTRPAGRFPVSGRPGRGAPNHRDDSQAGTEAEAAAAASAIAGLRWRLRRYSTLEHPAVRRELRQLDQQLAAQLDRAAHTPGRHRLPAGRSPGRPEARHDDHADQPGPRPDPATARTAAELITVLGQYTAWSGDPSWAAIAARSGQNIGPATIRAALHGTALPTLSLVTAVITGCGGSQDDLNAFTAAWQRITAACTTGHATCPGPQPAPAPALQLLPGT